MSWLGILLSMLLVGLVLGALARLALPGRDPMTILQTIAVGVAGSFLGGLISVALFGREAPVLFVSFVCSFLIVYAVRRMRGGSLTRPSGGRALRR